MTIRCAMCERSFDTEELLEIHRNEEHGSGNARAGEHFACPECGTQLSSTQSLEMHRHDAHGVVEVAQTG